MVRRWSKEDRGRLIWLWESQDIGQIASQLGRTEIATYFEAGRLGLLGREENHVSLKQLIEQSGFWKRAVLTAMARVGVEPHFKKRATPGLDKNDLSTRRYAFTAEEAELILAELRKHSGKERIMPSFAGEWGTGEKPAACLGCGRTDRPHRTHGLCTACARRTRLREQGVGAPLGYTPLGKVGRMVRRTADTLSVIAAQAGIEIVKWGANRYVRNGDVARLVEAAKASRRYAVALPEWGRPKRPAACNGCGRTDRRYGARGLCTTCLSRKYRKERQT